MKFPFSHQSALLRLISCRLVKWLELILLVPVVVLVIARHLSFPLLLPSLAGHEAFRSLFVRPACIRCPEFSHAHSGFPQALLGLLALWTASPAGFVHLDKE